MILDGITTRVVEWAVDVSADGDGVVLYVREGSSDIGRDNVLSLLLDKEEEEGAIVALY